MGYGATAHQLDGANSFISNVNNWDTGLPTSSNPGTIGINAKYDADVIHSGYNILHTDGDISRGNGFAAFILGEDSTYIMDGVNAAITQARGISVGANSSFVLNSGTANLIDNNRDTQVFGVGASITINGGAMTIGRDLINRDGGTFTINAGTITGIDQFFTQNFATASSGWYFNGGSTTADNFQLDTAGTAFFGGSASGSLTLLTGLGNGVTLDWSSGSLMNLSVAGADQGFYEGLYAGGNLLLEGSNSGSFSQNFAVSGSTLSLVLIPEPSSFALMGLCGLVLFSLRRRARHS